MSQWSKHPLKHGVQPGEPGGPKQMLARIQNMNEIFELEDNDEPTDLGPERLVKFYFTIRDEVDELLEVCYDEPEIIISDESICERDAVYERLDDYEAENPDMVKLADTLGDLIVYILSECNRWGIPIIPVFHAIMDSQDSKLVDGKPVKSHDGAKFIKGPNYVPPEPRIKEILENAKRS